MRLLTVRATSFQGIDKAELQFGPGLNVLYGPNALGKSSLAHAIRSALLLPAKSRATEALQSWHGAGLPSVELTFQTGPGQIWRVSKTFAPGSGSSAQLEHSTDGLSFSRDSRGRQVDERIRELLRWGVKGPGGRGGAKGYPDAFLTHALLAQQEDVAQILARGIADDSDESGKKHLSEALTALAQDPLFKAVLDRATEQQSEAFTATGRRSRSRTSPFHEIHERITELQTQRRALDVELGDSELAEQRIQQLNSEKDELQSALSEGQERLTSVQRDLEASAALITLEQAVATAKVVLTDIDEQLQTVSLEDKNHTQLAGAVQESKGTCEATKASETAARAKLKSAKAALDLALNQEGAETRARKQEELKNQLLMARQRHREAEAAMKSAEAVGELHTRVATGESELTHLQELIEEQQEALKAAERNAMAAAESLQLAESIALYGRLYRARMDLSVAEAGATAAASDQEQATRERRQADEIEKQLVDLNVPDSEALSQIRQIRQDLDVAEAALGGGLSVEVRPRSPLELRVAPDDKERQEFSGSEPIDVEAERSVSISVDDLVDIRITAGEQSARTSAEALREQWSVVGEPALKRSGVESVRRLGELRQQADELERSASDHRAKAQALEASADQGQESQSGIEEARARVEQRKAALPEGLEETLGESFAQLGEDWEAQLDSLKKDQAKADSEARQARESATTQLARLKTQSEERRLQLDKLRKELAGVESGTSKPWKERLEAAEADGTKATVEIEQLEQQESTLSGEIEGQEREARIALQGAEQHLEKESAALEAANEHHNALREDVAGAASRLKTLKEQAERLDRAAAVKAVEEAKQALAQAPAPAAVVTQQDLEAATHKRDDTKRMLEAKKRELDQARGALSQVGGEVVRERKRELDDALTAAKDRGREIELEYEGWKLLVATLRETENLEGAHLGNSLGPAVTDRFNTLTGGRYGALELDAHLKTDGVHVAGEARDFEALSAGTRDQLATLFRLTIAEHLGSAIVLDDHLTQSDEDKVGWFRDLLREMSERIQVVVLTCRPKDYLADAEFAGPDGPVNDRAGGLLKVVDLGRVVVGSG